MRRAAKKDANHETIADALRAAGYSVLDLSQAGNGIPDIAVGKPGFACLVECKDGDKPPSARRLTPDQERVLAMWTGPAIVAISPADALAQLEALQ